MDTPKNLPLLDSEEQRILGSLMEKSKTTPDYYPMTINALTAACNQKTSRNPVVNYEEETVVLTLDKLKRRGLISTATGGSSRAVKYKHNFAIVFPVVPAEVAIICLLLLRGALTPGEINTNSTRLYEFESLEEIQTILEKLSKNDPPYIAILPKKPGQKEIRYTHLLGESQKNDENMPTEIMAGKNTNNLENRLLIVEEELAELKLAFDKLMKELMG